MSLGVGQMGHLLWAIEYIDLGIVSMVLDDKSTLMKFRELCIENKGRPYGRTVPCSAGMARTTDVSHSDGENS